MRPTHLFCAALLACAARPDTLAAMIDSAVRLRVSSPVVLLRRLTALRRRGRAGVRQVERLLVDAGGESLLERQFLKLVRAAGLPRPITQARIAAHGQQVARVDFLYAEHALVVEVSGRVGHSSPADRARDAQRRNELQAEGFTVYEFTFEHVTRRPEWVVAQLSARLGRP